LLALAACAPKPETREHAQARLRAESDSTKTAILAANARFAAHMALGKADSAALSYAENAVFFPTGAPAIRGRAAIRAIFQQMMEVGTWHIAVSDVKVEASGPLAVETGRYVTGLTPGPDAPAGVAAMFPDSGNFLSTWRKVNGRWLMITDMSATTRAPAAAKKR
jgi:ketosteroid isomerase-like protein